MGGSVEKSPSKNFFELSNLSKSAFVSENPTHWGLETAVCQTFCKTGFRYFCSFFTGFSDKFVQYVTEIHMLKKSKLLTRKV